MASYPPQSCPTVYPPAKQQYPNVYPPAKQQYPSVYPPPQKQYSSVYPPAKQQALFALGTDPEIIRAFQTYDEDGSGFIDDEELQRAISTADLSCSIRIVHLLMSKYNNGNYTKIGPKQFTSLWHDLKGWRLMFEKVDRDGTRTIDSNELRDALRQLGYSVSTPIIQRLLTKYDRTGQGMEIDYDNFIECCIIVQRLTEKFKEKDRRCTGTATLTYEEFLLMVLPFTVA